MTVTSVFSQETTGPCSTTLALENESGTLAPPPINGPVSLGAFKNTARDSCKLQTHSPEKAPWTLDQEPFLVPYKDLKIEVPLNLSIHWNHFHLI